MAQPVPRFPQEAFDLSWPEHMSPPIIHWAPLHVLLIIAFMLRCERSLSSPAVYCVVLMQPLIAICQPKLGLLSSSDLTHIWTLIKWITCNPINQQALCHLSFFSWPLWHFLEFFFYNDLTGVFKAVCDDVIENKLLKRHSAAITHLAAAPFHNK